MFLKSIEQFVLGHTDFGDRYGEIPEDKGAERGRRPEPGPGWKGRKPAPEDIRLL